MVKFSQKMIDEDQCSATFPHIDEAIENVIRKTNLVCFEDDDEKEMPPTVSQAIWTAVTGRHHKVFDFYAVDRAISPAVADSLVDKNTL